MTTTTPAANALGILVVLAQTLGSTRDQLDAWREFATILDADGTLDGLDDNDARHAVAMLMYVLHHDGPDALRRRAAWLLEADERAVSASRDVHDLPAVCSALLRVADLADLPG